jgi:three-Cys-motif partner protein
MPITSTKWDKEPHTEAKHRVLAEHLKGWFPILSSKFGRVVYLDGFSGPGLYSNGEEGSPVIAIRIANEHVLNSKFHEIKFIFIEKDLDRAKTLEDVIKDRFTKISPNLEYVVINGEFATKVEEMLSSLDKDGLKLAPTFAFLDPFGYSNFPMKVISNLLSRDQCEVLITFMIRDINRFTDPLHADALDELFGGNGWRTVNSIDDSEQRKSFLLTEYVNQLKTHGGAKYVRTFEMKDKRNQTLYHLIFATKHLRGLEVMKDAMFRVDRSGNYLFADLSNPNQTFIMDYHKDYWIQQPAEELFKEFKGRTVNLEQIIEFVYDKTSFVFKKSILRYLEKLNPSRIVNVTNRKNPKLLSYPENCKITFSS